MVQNYQNAMVIYRWARCPDTFVTFTCNPQWPMIKCRNPTLAKCEDETHTPKVGDLETSETPEC